MRLGKMNKATATRLTPKKLLSGICTNVKAKRFRAGPNVQAASGLGVVASYLFVDINL